MNGTTSNNDDEELPFVEVFLSRPAYPVGTALVGTVVIRHRRPTLQHHQQPLNHAQKPLRELLQSVVVYSAGFCRIDPRWHNVSDYTKIYGTVHPMLQMLYSEKQFEEELLKTNMQAGEWSHETVCFWATNGLELLELNERTGGEWDFSEDMLAFTFRVDIPLDLPHSINAATCRYYYSADVLIKTKTKQQVIKTPFLVWANPDFQYKKPSKQNMIISGRVKIATCQGMAHSIGLPCHLTASEIHRPRGQMTVALPQHNRGISSDVQTLKVSNTNGHPVCIMTVVGVSKLTRGSRVHLHWDFPETISASKDWIPCHQVSACLMGEEFAVYEDGTTKRSQAFVFDTCHEWVDPGVTHRVSKTLLLSMDAPCNLYTDVMEMSVQCRVDIVIKENGEYNNLRIDLPCQVVHSFGSQDQDIFDQAENKIMPLTELLGVEQDPKESMPINDIISDLKVLALQMEERLRDGSSADKGLSS